MLKDNKIDIRRMIFLENWLLEHKLDKESSLEEKITFFKSNGFNKEEIAYLINAYLIPYPIIFSYWSSFKNSNIEMESLKFYNTLQSTFNVDFDTIEKRIEAVKTIDAYFLKKSKTNPFVNSEYYDSLLQNHIFNVPLYKDEMTHYKNYDEYWAYLMNQIQEKMNRLQNALEKSERRSIILEMEPLLKEMSKINNYGLNDMEFFSKENNKKI